jgi:hypothetical protein
MASTFLGGTARPRSLDTLLAQPIWTVRRAVPDQSVIL